MWYYNIVYMTVNSNTMTQVYMNNTGGGWSSAWRVGGAGIGAWNIILERRRTRSGRVDLLLPRGLGLRV